MELADLNLVTYVIKFNGGRYYTNKDGRIEDWARPYGTDNLAEASIYNDLAHAQRICKQLTKTREATVLPVSKKIFFEAALKGDR